VSYKLPKGILGSAPQIVGLKSGGSTTSSSGREAATLSPCPDVSDVERGRAADHRGSSPTHAADIGRQRLCWVGLPYRCCQAA
jgi:hypothetical protein